MKRSTWKNSDLSSAIEDGKEDSKILHSVLLGLYVFSSKFESFQPTSLSGFSCQIGQGEKMKCYCRVRIDNHKLETKEEKDGVFKMCQCSSGCQYCAVNNLFRTDWVCKKPKIPERVLQ